MKGNLRMVFWAVFIPVAVVAGIYFWQRGISQRIDRYLKLMTHQNARVADRAWRDLHELYFTRWAAYHVILEHTGDTEPINFLIERDKRPVPGKAAVIDFVSRGKPVFYKTDQIYCRTVGEAILAFVYNERKWRTDFEGDWEEWWARNKGMYGKP